MVIKLKALLIAEKPDLMRKVKEAYTNRGFKDTIYFASFHGHVMTLLQPHEYNESWEKWSLETLPMIPDNFRYKAADTKTVNDLKKLIKEGNFDYLINCCDPDREGQHIFYSFYDSINCKLPVKRMWHADLTEDELIRALNHMEDDLNTPRLSNMKDASKLRAQMDWLVGMNASRIVSIKRKSVSRIGRVVTPTFKILATRELAIKNFKPVTTYGVEALYTEGFKGEYVALKKDETNKTEAVRFPSKSDAEKFINSLSNTGKIVSVDSVKNTEKAPQLPSIADLQMMANRMYGYTLDKTLALVQSLYEKKIVSYPRTDCCYVTQAIANDFGKILKSLQNVSGLESFVSSISNTDIERLKKDKRYVNDAKVTAHYAIIPTGFSFSENLLTYDEKVIFELIAKRFISIFMNPCLTEKTYVRVDVNGELFESYGAVVLDRGYKALYGSGAEDNTLPKVEKGQVLNVSNFECVEHVSKAPARYTDATLLNAMINAGSLIEDEELSAVLSGDSKVKDSGGIGTPATRAAIVNKIVEPIKKKDGSTYNLAERKGKSFFVTEEGLRLAESLNDFTISSPELTAIWEQKLREVEDGSLTKTQFIDDMHGYIKKMTEELMNGDYGVVDSAQGTSSGNFIDGATCPYCGGKIKQSAKYYYCEHYAKEGGCNFILKKELNGAKITEPMVKDLCNGKTTKQVKMISEKSGKQFMCGLKVNTEAKKIEFAFDTETKYTCPNCGKKIVQKTSPKGVKYYTCEGGDLSFMANIAGHKLTASEIKDLLAGKEIGPFDDFVAKSGKNFPAKLQVLKDKVIFNF